MRFEIVHDFEMPLDALELAVLSPSLIEKLASRLPNVESVSQMKHDLQGGVLERVWSYQANVKIPEFARGYVTREMLAWDQRSTYRIQGHKAEWSIVPHVKPEWRKFFSASGTYTLRTWGEGSTRRVVEGDIQLRVPNVFRQLGERMIVAEVKKTFEAEAATLRDLATLV